MACAIHRRVLAPARRVPVVADAALAWWAMSFDRYGSDVLNTDWRAPRRGRSVEIEADKGLVVEEVTTDWCGEIVAVDRDIMTVTLEDRRHKLSLIHI